MSEPMFRRDDGACDEDFSLRSGLVLTLSLREVRDIYASLCEQFASTSDPIEPRGERRGGLLESAVARQHASFDGRLMYPTAVENAATLAFGICKNHPFHNGNKRTALVALLVHLDRNRLVMRNEVQHRHVYEFIKALADDGLDRLVRGARGAQRTSMSSEQYSLCVAWIRHNTRGIRRGERQIRMRDLKRILDKYGYEVADPIKNFSDIVKIEEVVEHRWLGLRTVRRPVRKKVYQIACAGMNQVVPITTVKAVRKACGLTERDGVDSEAFYASADRLDYFLNYYRKILIQLGKE